MTGSRARTAANLILVSAGVAAAYMVLTRPPLRRRVFRAARIWLGAGIPMYLVSQTRQAWLESGRAA